MSKAGIFDFQKWIMKIERNPTHNAMAHRTFNLRAKHALPPNNRERTISPAKEPQPSGQIQRFQLLIESALRYTQTPSRLFDILLLGGEGRRDVKAL